MWTRGEVPGTRYGLIKDGCTDQELFKRWLKDYFLKHSVHVHLLILLVVTVLITESIIVARENSFIIFFLHITSPMMSVCLDLSNNTGGKFAIFFAIITWKSFVSRLNFCQHGQKLKTFFWFPESRNCIYHSILVHGIIAGIARKWW